MRNISIYTLLMIVCANVMARPNVGVNKIAPDRDQRARARSFANTCEPASQSADLDVNNVRTKILNGGDMWWDLNNPKYEIPKTNDPNTVKKHSLFSGAIWIGGKDGGGNLKLAAMTYRQRGSDFWPGPLDQNASTDPARCKAYDRLWKVSRDELEDFVASNYTTASPDIRDWPAGENRTMRSGTEPRLMAPFKDNDNNPYDYNVLNGDHPVLDDTKSPTDNGPDKQPDQFIWWVYNDKGNIHSETQGQPIGIELRASAFAFSTNDEINNMTFYTTQIYLRSTVALKDVYMGQWVDADLGNYADDYVGCDVGRSLGICYNGDDDDEGVLGYGLNPPSVGVDYFEGPDSNGKQLGLSHFMYYNNDQDPIRGNPDNAPEFYNLLQGKWLGGQTVTRGGTGFGGSRPCKYMFPGDTDPDFPGECWDEKSSNNKPGDRRFIQSTGPFELKGGAAAQKITTGVVWARTTSGGAGALCGSSQGSIQLLKQASDKAQSLFNNKFVPKDGPDAPDVEIQELTSEVVMKFLNTQTDKVEKFNRTYKNTKNDPINYQFEGYLIYQLADGTVSSADLDNIDKARLMYQCDLSNRRGLIINKIFDAKVNQLVPVVKVEGEDKGLKHSFSITKDLFATTSNTNLIDFKPYYYMVLSYAITGNDPLTIEPEQFLAGRRNIRVYKAIPHNTSPENFGTTLKSGYGSGPQLTQLAGRGNGGNVLEFTKETVDKILQEPYVVKNPVYMGGYGPVKVKVVDPLKVPNHQFELYLKPRKSPGVFRDSISANSDWFLVNKTTGDTIKGDTTIARQFESTQGKNTKNKTASDNFPTLADWGLSVEITQVKNPGEDAVGDPTNGLLSWEVKWQDPGRQWLTAIADNDAASTQQTRGSWWTNWIRAGSAGRGEGTFDGYTHDYFRTLGSPGNAVNTDPFDPSGSFEKIWNGRMAPYALASRKEFNATNGANTFGVAFKDQAILDNPLTEIHSIQIVITPDRSKWTRAIVLEMADEQVQNSTQGNVAKFSVRKGTSLDKNFNPISGSEGLSYFPGYAINLETGERLNMAFGEDSYLDGENGRDMIWNPTSKVYNDNGNYPAIGGKHFIYVFGTGKSMPGRNIIGRRYLGDDINNYKGTIDSINGGIISKKQILSRITWCIPAYLAGGYEMKNGVPPTEVSFTVNIKKAYNTDNVGNTINNNIPFYSFSGSDIAPIVNNEIGKQSLDLVNVVPNPYRGFSKYETSPIDSRVKITNLPPECTISIFDISGNLVRKFNKADDATFLEWDLKNTNGVPIATGLYLIHVKSKKLGEKVVRWYGIMHTIDLDTY